MYPYSGYAVWFVLIVIVISLFWSCQQPAESYELWEKAQREVQS